MKIISQTLSVISFIFLFFIFSGLTFGQTTTFTYQGKLNDSSMAANGNYLLEFRLFDSQTVGTGSQIGATLTDVPASVVNGIFTVQLDFGANAFDGTDRFLEISVRRNSGETYVTLAPRQPVTSAPYSIKSKNAETATTATTASNSNQLGGINASEYVLTTDTRMTDARVPLPGSGSYIQNTTAVQASSNFNISGEGKAGSFNAVTQYKINGNQILSNAGTFNLFVGTGAGGNNTGGFNTFVGADAGRDNTTGNQNAFFGRAAGAFNTTGFGNTFVGRSAGLNNTTGEQNSFFGQEAGLNNTIAKYNAFFGALSGRSNTTGDFNSFFGTSTGLFNSTGNSNAFFGIDSGRNNSTGSNNSFYGAGSGQQNTTGVDNVFIGRSAGNNNVTGSGNTAIGSFTTFGAQNLQFATAIGSNSVVSTSNTIAMGRTAGEDTVLIYGRLKLNSLGSAGSTTLCRNASNEISTCSSSLRYKNNIADFNSGLSIISRLRPITFNWINGGKPDLGLGAEEVAAVEQNLIIRNENGEVEGVKYDRIGVVLINAVNEQQTQIEAQRKQIEEQKIQIELLKQFVCSQNKTAAVCR